MDQPCYAPVIGSQFIASKQCNVIVDSSSGEFVITNDMNKIILKMRSCDTTFHTQWLLVDAWERPIALLRDKNMTGHARWNVFKGQSKASSDKIFSATTNHMFQDHTHVNVSLANKMSRDDDCDFQIKGNWATRNCAIYKGDSSTIIAKMSPLEFPGQIMVTIYPNVDYAFVVALIPIVVAMESYGTMKVVAAHAVAHVAAHAAACAAKAGFDVAVHCLFDL